MHLGWIFWAFVLGTGVWLRAAPVRRTTAFGLVNALALAVLAGTEGALAGLAVAVALWATLRAATAGSAPVAAIARRLVYLVPVAAFFGYKVAGDWPSVREWVAAVEPAAVTHRLLAGL